MRHGGLLVLTLQISLTMACVPAHGRSIAEGCSNISQSLCCKSAFKCTTDKRGHIKEMLICLQSWQLLLHQSGPGGWYAVLTCVIL